MVKGKKEESNISLRLEETRDFLDWKKKFNADRSNSRCGSCLYFRSPKCVFASMPVEAGDESCISFYPIAERLRVNKRHRRLKQYLAKKVEQL